MTPDQLKYLTDEERRAWEELSGFFAAGLNIVARRLNGSRKAAPINRYMPGAERYLSAALEALADARRERDEARAELANERGEGEPPSPGWTWDGSAWLSGDPDGDDHVVVQHREQAPGWEALLHLSDGSHDIIGERNTARELMRHIDAGRAAATATPGGDPAPRGAGTPDAAGGALGVGLRSTIFECRCCDRVSNGYNDGSVTEPGWHDIDGIDGPDAICPECVKDPTALDSLRADGYDNARIGGARPVAGALGVGAGLTNCDNCAHDYGYFEGFGREVRGCRRLDNDESDYDAINDWSTRWCSTRRDARPDPGATGCPGWAKRGEG